MSSGTFTNSRYQASYGDGLAIHPIRVQPETIAASVGSVTNAPPSGAVNNPIQARATGGRRSFGLVARFVTLRAPATDQPDNYQPLGFTRIPALTETFYDACTKDAVVTYLGSSYTVSGRSGERVDGTDGN